MNQAASSTWINRLLGAAIILILALLLYFIFSSVHTVNNTGVLKVRSSQNQSILSISQVNSEAKVIGTGSATVRLKSGNYQLVATSAGLVATKTITISVKTIKNVNLTLHEPVDLRSADSITFNNFNSLRNKGMTIDQLANIKQTFFDYKSASKVVSINSDSVQIGPYDHTSANPVYSINFNGLIDGDSFRATATYIDLSRMSLVLYDTKTDKQLYPRQ